MRNVLPILYCCLLVACQENKQELPIQQHTDIGLFKDQLIASNSFQYDEVTQTYRLPADATDEYRLLWTALNSDFVLDVKLPKVIEAGTYVLLFSTDDATTSPTARLEIDNDMLSVVPDSFTLGSFT